MATTPRKYERIGHRGLPAELRENTLPSFELALHHGADAIELDVHLTSDGRVVVHHDPTVGAHTIARATWQELSSLDLGGTGGGARIPLLDDVLATVGDRAAVYIELKGRNIEDEVVVLAKKRGRRFALHSFDHDAMARLADKAPEVARGALLDRGTEDPVAALRQVAHRLRVRDVWPHWSLVDEAFMRAAGALGVRVITWTVNSIESAARLASLDVAGICTDDVRLLERVG